MAWLKIDDQFVEHTRIEKLGDRAFRLHVAALCSCARKLTDGHISTRDLKVLRALIGANGKHIDELQAAGLWQPNGDGYVIRDYLDYNPSAETVREERARAAERMRHVRANVRPNRKGNK